MLNCTLSISDLRCEVRLGCKEDERARPQGVRFDVAIRFAEVPAGAWTDELDGTICYAEIAEVLRDVCKEREYRLIERLGREAYERVSRIAGQQGLWLKVTKLEPPVPGLGGGASFELGER